MADPSVQEYSSASSATTGAATPRLFWVGMAVFLIVMVLLGFGSTYGRQLAFGTEIGADGPYYSGGVVETDWVIHLHAAVFVGWMALLLAQTVLAARGRIQAHMTLGKYGGPALAVALVVTGSLIVYTRGAALVSAGRLTWAQVPALPQWTDLLTFIALLGLGLFYRSRPPLHKRYMILATVLVAGAAAGRMGYLLGSLSGIFGLLLMLAPLFAYDLYTEGRIHPGTLCGTGIIVFRLAVVFAVGSLVF